MSASVDKIVIGRSSSSKPGKLAYLGKRFAGGKLGPKVYIDLARTHRIMVFGQTGNGKSYTLGVLAEEIADQKAGDVLILDPMSIFWALNKANEKGLIETHWGVTSKQYNSNLFALKGSMPKEFAGAGKEFALHGHEFSPDEIQRILRIDPGTQMASAVQTGINELDKKTKNGLQDPNYSLADIADQTFRSYRSVIHPATRNALEARFLTANSWDIFDTSFPSVEEIVLAQGISVVLVGWLGFLGKNVPADTLFGVLSDAVIRAKHRAIRADYLERTRRQWAGQSLKSKPSWLILDEAKEFIPPGSQSSRTREIIEDWVEQGRNYGASIVIATQSPELIDAKVIAQSDILITHRLQTDENIRALAKGVRGLMVPAVRGVLEDLPIDPGYAVVFESSLEAPLMIKVRNRKSFHAGQEP
jgi:DNA helicase HerA-like ATPase